MKRALVFISTVILLFSLQVSNSAADGPFPGLYVETNITETTVKLASGKFEFALNGLKLGYNVTPKIAVEAHYMRGLGDDNIGALRAEINNVISAYVRLGSTVKKDLRSYILIGQSNVSLDYNPAGVAKNESLEDLSWAIGAEERLRRWPLFILNAEYLRHYDHDGSKITSMSLGLRYEF